MYLNTIGIMDLVFFIAKAIIAGGIVIGLSLGLYFVIATLLGY